MDTKKPAREVALGLHFSLINASWSPCTLIAWRKSTMYGRFPCSAHWLCCKWPEGGRGWERQVGWPLVSQGTPFSCGCPRCAPVGTRRTPSPNQWHRRQSGIAAGIDYVILGYELTRPPPVPCQCLAFAVASTPPPLSTPGRPTLNPVCLGFVLNLTLPLTESLSSLLGLSSSISTSVVFKSVGLVWRSYHQFCHLAQLHL